ncbi:hypothetical protein FKM82_028003 [Ascaphus truei]
MGHTHPDVRCPITDPFYLISPSQISMLMPTQCSGSPGVNAKWYMLHPYTGTSLVAQRGSQAQHEGDLNSAVKRQPIHTEVTMYLQSQADKHGENTGLDLLK